MAQFVGGRYQLIAQLGGGGMADVYLAKLSGKADFAKLAVVKRLKPVEDDDPEILKMFADEARLCARLNHPTIVQTFEVGEDSTGPFLVMEYIEGQSLQRIRSRMARRSGVIPRAIALRVLCETLSGLSYAHTLVDHDGTPLTVVHRDVSPENIMVTYAGSTKLVDFGVAKTSASINRTRAGVLKGKVAYMAPEQARSDTTIDARADVFAAGLVLWELLTYQRIWEGKSEAQVFERLLDKDPLPHVRAFDPSIPEDLDAICAQAIAKEKEDRFSSAAALLTALETAIAKHDYRTSTREIGEFVANLFQVEREKVRALVTTAVKKNHEPPEPLPPNPNRSFDRVVSKPPPPEPTEAPEPVQTVTVPMSMPEPPPPPSDPIPPMLGSQPSITIDGMPPADTPFAIVETKPAFSVRRQRGPRVGVYAGAIVGLSIVGAGLLVGARMLPKAQAPARPVVTIVQSAAPVATDVTVDIAVRPPEARIAVDGQQVPGNPYHLKTTKSDRSHEIRAEADGYEPHTVVLSFDRDRGLDLALVRLAPQPAASSSAPAPIAARGRRPPRPAAAPPKPDGIAEVDLAKPKPTKHDKIDTDVFGKQ